MRTVAYEARHAGALAGLFRACDCTCFCRYWHFEGDKNAWLERGALRPEESEAEMRADAEMSGVLALDGDTAVGWMKLAPRASLPKLRTGRVYRALDLGDDEGVLSIGCMLVHPGRRRSGVARAMVLAAIELTRERRARAIEAYPHTLAAHAPEQMWPQQMWMGPYELFASLGFVRVAGEAPYPVLRFTI